MSTSPSLIHSLVRPLAVVLFFALAVMPVLLLGIDGPWLGPGAPSMRGRHDLPAHFRTDFFTAFDSWFADRIGLRLVLIRIGTGFHVGVLQRPTAREVVFGLDGWMFWPDDGDKVPVTMADGVTILPPRQGLATVAMYADGSIRLGAWGRDMTTTLDLIDYRQNCPLLVDAGQINPSVTSGSRQAWGYTVNNADTTWRSGLGLSRDGRFLIYAVGNSLTVEALARALQQGDADSAMQLDINGFYTRFVTYQVASNAQTPANALVANKLLNQMTGDQLQFLKPYDRDFFYVTAKQDLHRPTRFEKKGGGN